MKTIKTGKSKPAEKFRGTVVNKPIEYGTFSASSDFDKRADQGGVAYVGPSKMGGSGFRTQGNKQSKKHKSSGKGQ